MVEVKVEIVRCPPRDAHIICDGSWGSPTALAGAGGRAPARAARPSLLWRPFFNSFLSIFEAEAFAIGFEDVDAMSQSVQERSG